MGNWDCYCALCRAPFHQPDLETRLESIRNKNFSLGLFDWAYVLQVVGQNPQADGLSRCYISKEGHAALHGSVWCKPSNNPNCPRSEVGSEIFGAHTYYNSPNSVNPQFGVIPVHEKCLQIFQKVLAREKGASVLELDSGVDVDPDVLFEALRERHKVPGLDSLEVDYYELDTQERYENVYWFLEPQKLVGVDSFCVIQCLILSIHSRFS